MKKIKLGIISFFMLIIWVIFGLMLIPYITKNGYFIGIAILLFATGMLN